MGAYAVSSLVKAMLRRRIQVEGARVLVLGLTFKENCPDLRNTRVVDIVSELEDYHVRVDVHDPWADADEARAEYGYELVAEPEQGAYDGIVLAVAHEQFKQLGAEALRRWGRPEHVLFDLKSMFPRDASDLRL
jgi:UDP-N-acetyl-D-galactosamine dehydrogenase